MSIKDIILSIISSPSTYAVPIGVLGGWSLKKRKDKSEVRKSELSETSISIENRIKEDEYTNERINRLLHRVVEVEKSYDDLILQMQDMSRRLLHAAEENRQLKVELTLYKTIN